MNRAAAHALCVDPLAVDYTVNPQQFFADIHERGPVFTCSRTGAWMVFGYDAVRLVVSDKRFSRSRDDWTIDRPLENGERWPLISALRAKSPFVSEASHRASRALFSTAFSPRAIRRMNAIIEDVVAQFCAPITTDEAVDLAEMVEPIPNTVISRIIGIPRDDGIEAAFREAAAKFIRGSNPLASDEAADRAEEGTRFLFDHMQALIDQRHRQPEDDLISHLIQGAAETGATDELIKISACSLLSAGSDTTRHGAVLALRTLLTHPEVRAQLAADRSLLDHGVLELLRYDFPAKFLVRFATTEVEVAGVAIPAGAMVLSSLHGAGWDPGVFPSPERIDFSRDPRRSTVFGYGDTYCLGAHLARFQLATLLDYLLDRLPAEVTVDESRIAWEPPDLVLRGVAKMPVQLRH